MGLAPPYVVIAESDREARGLATEIAAVDPRWRDTRIAARIEALRTVETLRPGAVVVSMNGDSDAALVLIQRIRARFTSLALIAVAQKPNPDGMNPNQHEIQALEMCRAAFRAGASEFLTQPLLPEEWSKAQQRLASHQDTHTVYSEGKLLVFVGACGGAGVTTVACNTAVSLAQSHPNQTALVDWNFHQGDVAITLDCHATYSVADLLEPARRSAGGRANETGGWSQLDETLVRSALVKHESSLCVLVQPDLIGLDEELDGQQGVELFTILRRMFPYLCVDAGHGINRDNAWLLQQADSIMLLGTQDLTSVHNVRRMAALLDELEIKRTNIRYILNRYDRRHRITLAKAAEATELEVAATVPLDGKLLPESINSGRPVNELFPRSPLAKSFHSLAVSLNGKLPEEPVRRFFGFRRKTKLPDRTEHPTESWN